MVYKFECKCNFNRRKPRSLFRVFTAPNIAFIRILCKEAVGRIKEGSEGDNRGGENKIQHEIESAAISGVLIFAAGANGRLMSLFYRREDHADIGGVDDEFILSRISHERRDYLSTRFGGR